MPAAEGKVPCRGNVTEATKRYLDQCAETDGCALGEVIDKLVERSKVQVLDEVTMPLVRVEDRFDRLESMLKQRQAHEDARTEAVEVRDGPPPKGSAQEALALFQRIARTLDEHTGLLRRTLEPKPRAPTPPWNHRTWRRLGLLLAILLTSASHLTFLWGYLDRTGWHPQVYLILAAVGIVSLGVVMGKEVLDGRA